MDRATGTDHVHQLFADYWEWQLRENPLMATIYCGDHRYDDRLPRAHPDEYVRRLADLQDFHRRWQALPREGISGSDLVNYDLFGGLLQHEIDELRLGGNLFPLNRTTGFVEYITDLPELLAFGSIGDYENYLARLRAVPTYVEDHIALMRRAVQEGYLPPSAILQGVDEAIARHIVDDPTHSRFWQPFASFSAPVSAVERDQLLAAARAAIVEQVVPAFRSLLQFVRVDYLPTARLSVGASELPDGAAFYQHRIHYFTSLPLSAEEVHQTGMEEVRRLREEMEEVMRATGFSGTFAEFLTFLRTDSRFYAPTPEVLLREAAFLLKRMDGELPRLFHTLPRAPYGIRAVPAESAPANTTAYYVPPADDGTRAGFYYVNTYDLRSRPLYELEALSLHEAVPGHHLQIALQLELGELPAFRRFGGYVAFVEGWALYAERLGLEIGFYQDPYSNFGRLTYEMWRACRLVVDTGLHALGWTREQAIAFMVEHTALTALNIANEVDRYIAWPGQALAYKLGELTIRRLRARAESELGSRFDLRAFHDVVLRGGAVPLDLLEESVVAWWQQQRGERAVDA